MMNRLRYWRRIGWSYLLAKNSNLTFWHERPAVHPGATYNALGPYYMTFADKSLYPGPFDANGVPMLDYHGDIGRQYNPIAIAQFGLAHYNLFLSSGDERNLKTSLTQADWLVDHLERNPKGLAVWMHHFDFDYRETLRAPWYSGLAQGQGLSLLARAYRKTGEARYLKAMDEAFACFGREVSDGGVRSSDRNGDVWIEEYIVDPPTRILNGFIWAMWGVRDYDLAVNSPDAKPLFAACVDTLERNLARFDNGRWSLYELSGTWLPMLASPFYHRLHCVQLRVLAAMTGRSIFMDFAKRWEGYAGRFLNRNISLAQKCAFKLTYY